MIRDFATIISRDVGSTGLNVDINNIKCPICGQKMNIIRLEIDKSEMEADRRGYDKGRLMYIKTRSRFFDITWNCSRCIAELSATGRAFCEHLIDLG